MINKNHGGNIGKKQKQAEDNFEGRVGNNNLGCASGPFSMFSVDKFNHNLILTLFYKKDIKARRIQNNSSTYQDEIYIPQDKRKRTCHSPASTKSKCQ